jgi:hypothetical protein
MTIGSGRKRGPEGKLLGREFRTFSGIWTNATVGRYVGKQHRISPLLLNPVSTLKESVDHNLVLRCSPSFPADTACAGRISARFSATLGNRTLKSGLMAAELANTIPARSVVVGLPSGLRSRRSVYRSHCHSAAAPRKIRLTFPASKSNMSPP